MAYDAATGLDRLRAFARANETLRLIGGIVGFDGLRKCLVGGVVRDLLLGRGDGAREDLDFVLGHPGHFLVREVAKRLRARAARLENKQDETWRILAGDGLILDFTVLPEGRPMEANLATRDFAANAIAYDLDRHELVDPTGGCADLAARRFRALPGAFAADPLRILRGARFVATFPGFSLDPESVAAATATAPRLAEIPGERVREELFKLMAGEAAGEGFALLRKTGAEATLFAGIAPAGVAAPDAGTLHAAARRFHAAPPPGLEPADPAAPAMALFCEWLLAPRLDAHAAGAATADQAAAKDAARTPQELAATLERLRFANREAALARRLAEATIELADAARLGPVEDWRLVDLVNTLRGDARFVSLLAERAAARTGARSLADAASALDAALRDGRGLDLPRLLDGRDLLAMGVSEGPEIGRLLALVRRGQLEGAILSRSDACRFVIERLGAESAAANRGAR